MIARLLIYGLLVLSLALTAVTGWLTTTEAGSRWVLQQLPADIILIEGVRGTFSGGLQFDNLQVSTESTRVNLSAGELALNLFSLMMMELSVDRLQVATVIVNYHPVSPAVEKGSGFEGLPLRIRIRDMKVDRLLTELPSGRYEITAVEAAGVLAGTQLSLSDLTAHYQDYRVTAQLQLGLKPPFAFESTYQLNHANFQVVGQVEGTPDDLAGRGVVTAGELNLTYDANYNPARSPVPLSATVSAAVINLEPWLQQPLQAQAVSTRIESDFSNIRFEGTGILQSPWVLDLELAWQLEFQGDELSITQATARAMNGEGTFDGSWQLAEQKLALNFNFRDLSPDLLKQSLPLAVDASVDAQGQFSYEAGVLNLIVASLQGELNEHKVFGKADFLGSNLSNGQAHAELMVGVNRLQAEFDGGQQLLRLGIDGQDLAMLSPDISGELQFSAEQHFPFRQSAGTAELAVRNLRLLNYQLKNLQASLVQDSQGSGILQLNLQDLQRDGRLLGELQLSLQGNLQQQTGQLAWQRDSMSFVGQINHEATGLTLPVDSQQLTGVLKLTDSQFTGLPQTVSNPDLTLSYATGVIKLGQRSCWQGDTYYLLCLSAFTLQGGDYAVQADVSEIPVDIAGLPWATELSINGMLEAQLQLASAQPGWQGQFSAQVPDTLLKWSDSEQDQVIIPLELHGLVAEYSLSASLSANAGQDYRLMSAISVNDIREPANISADSRIDVTDLSLLTPLLPLVTDGQGSAQGRARYVQEGGVPALSGQLTVGPNASFRVPLLGLNVQEVEIGLSAQDQNQLDFNASASSGDGLLKVSGQVEHLLQAGRRVSATIQGQAVTLADRPEIRLVTSPDMKLQFSGGLLRAVGNLSVSNSMVNEKILRTPTRSRSADVVVVQDSAPDNGQLTELDLQLTAGEKVHLVMYGLDADVQGTLRVRQSVSRPRQVEGTLNLLNGSFSRYGVEFSLERGRLIYKGSLANPIVDVVARRDIVSSTGTVTIRLVMSGPADDIQSQLVSSPAMSEADALSYLVLGRSLSGSTQQDGNALANAAVSFGLKKAVPITAEIQNKLGLDELTLTGRDVDTTTVVAGKRLNRRVYLEYHYGVFSRVGGLLLDYQLNDRLSLQAQSSDEDSLELIYTF
ncbi:MAG: translocation/assembly module TamB domain-containing protein [Pseudomonadales bacterium]|nr:translocation/assembly module TamB domain-containing protein [Pseudomonadales bacterium]